MDLLSSYASSDDDDDLERESHPHLPNPTELQPSTSIFFSSLPRPTTRSTDDVRHPFSSLPKPSASSATARRIVQIIPSIPPPNSMDDDDDEEEKKRKRLRDSRPTTQAPSVRSFLSSIPLPRNSSTLGASTSSSGLGRRSILENETTPIPDVPNPPAVEIENGSDTYIGHEFGGVPGYANGAAYQETYTVAYDEAGAVGWNGVPSDGGYEQGSYGVHSEFGVIGDVRKRGRKEANVEMVEVKQDELMKNRPREDQMKLTGIAFGPSHQPASTNKGKPSKLHKRKHQIGSLYFDMKQKETELQERRARGLLTKSQTQGKYGW